eukprot:2002603-Amphidinium_carterae.1
MGRNVHVQVARVFLCCPLGCWVKWLAQDRLNRTTRRGLPERGDCWRKKSRVGGSKVSQNGAKTHDITTDSVCKVDDRTRDCKLMSLCMLLSSIFVLNTKGVLNEGLVSAQ